MRLDASPIGAVVRITGFDSRYGEEYTTDAFVPHDLPTSVELPEATWMEVTAAMTELGRLDAAARLIPNPQLVTRVAIRREAIGTSALEGTYADAEDVFAGEVLVLDGRSDEVARNVREVINYAQAAEAAYHWIETRPLSLSMLSDLQAMIVEGTASAGLEAGAIRERQVFIGPKDGRVADAHFVPPPPGPELRAAYERLIRWVEAPEVKNSITLLARVAMGHYQFETLHPYTDGNGRLGRLMAVLHLMQDEGLGVPALSLSRWLEERADEYRAHLRQLSATGDWGPWIEFFAAAVRSEARAGHDRVMRLVALRDEVRTTVGAALPRARLALEIADSLIGYPMLTVADSTRRHGRSNQANRNAIRALVDLGILEPYGAAQYDQMYWSRRVLREIHR